MIVGPVRPIVLTLLGGAALLLIIASINIAGLLLVRAEGRRREIAVRAALGASRWRIVRRFAGEAIVLVSVGAALGVAGAWVGILFSLAPVLQLSLGGRAHALAEGGRGTAGRTWTRIGGKLVAVELALAMVLIAGGVLLARSLYSVLHVSVGMVPEHVAMIGVDVPSSYKDDVQLAALQRRVRERAEALPGVESAGAASTRPLQGGNTRWIQVVGRPYHGEHNEVNGREIDDGYFRTIRARMVRGRGIEPTDNATKPHVVVVNQALVRKYFPGEDPIGRKLRYTSNPAARPIEIVGIVDDIKESQIDAVTAPTMYTPFAQEPDTGFWLFVRTSQSEESLLPALASAIHQLDPDLATFGANRLTHMIDDSEPAYLRRSGAWLVGAFAALAWLLGVGQWSKACCSA